ncbi:hypothetical protein ASF49_21470 [Methylobacterium sp. Leaf104]|uniref:hypothetical protein n=1 Tax=Methylobacterium TaxID=407 RepID=UPI0006F492D1|nr:MULTISPECIES: hypothetical protein [Methylobacterium]KQP40073.1 hypothetical protein ASF49_21470 [Methylobacterium sp. Leaf104]MCI9881959.1 hypothetical protein [Methylobacterium goesingense]
MISRRHALATVLMVLSVPARAEPTIGLAERRAIAAYRQDRYPALEKAIQEAAGFPVPVEVAWDQLTIPGDAKYYSDPGFFEKTIFEPIAAGLKEVAKDTMGREALAQKLKTIRVRFDEKTAPASNYPNGLTFTGGVLDVNWRPFANVADFKDRVEAVVKVLEKGL